MAIVDGLGKTSPRGTVFGIHLSKTHLLNDVITIESMADYGGAGMRIETFARLLFDQWAIGQAKVNGQLWNA